MSLQFQSKTTWKLAALVLAAGIFACPGAWAGAASKNAVQTYVNQAVPRTVQADASFGTPLRAGQMTLEEVLESHPLPKKPSLQAPNLKTGAISAAPPVLKSATQASTEGDMLMQGMKTVLQQSGAETSPLKAPHLSGAAASEPASSAPPSSASSEALLSPPTLVGSSSGVRYQPGQEPKNLSSGAPLDVTPSASSSETASEACEPHNEKWTRTCTEAGYPENFTGQITGETHTVCPGNILQDVWVTNSCGAPEGSETSEAAAPLSAPSSRQPAEETAASSVTTMPGEQTDGSCGPANGLAAIVKPAGDLCVSGQVGDVTGEGPWRWNCMGIGNGMTVSCAAPVAEASSPASAPESAPKAAAPEPSAETTASEDGQCGSSDGAGTDQAPATGLCVKGIVSHVNGDGPWTWACSGRNGGQAVACTAPKKTDGVCGEASGANADGMPMENLCNAGYASAITGGGPWNWTCSGLYGGSPALCSAAPKKDAVCGTASLYGHREAPKDDLCSVGQASDVSGGGPWNWTCNGSNGGSPVACISPIKVSGNCGAANGVAAGSAPSEDLCNHGKPTRVTGEGPWSWTCSGTDGGDSESCTAPVDHAASATAGKSAAPAETPSESTSAASTPAPAAANEDTFGLCGAASELAAFEAPSKDLCVKGEAGAVTGDGPWKWTCSDSGHKADCSTLSPAGAAEAEAVPAAKPHIGEMPPPKAAPAAPVAKVQEKATCGPAAGHGTVSAPAEGLCAVGKPGAVRGHGPWSWTCAKGKGKAPCDAPKLQDAACGTANGSMQTAAPSGGLCKDGLPTQIQGNGPWMWSCVGSGGGASVSCSAAAQSQTRIDGACGAAASAPAPSAPTTSLCDSGMPSAVNGGGPWTWTCSGLNGGIASLCSARKNTLPAPPPPGPMVNGLCGDANGATAVMQPEDGLCSGGTATAVSGNGPWNWSCIGANGGMAVSCTALLQPPSPITGVCGGATGVPTLTTPKSGLCAAGISSAVSGKGPWTWSCSGTNGGGAVACVAPLAGSGGTGLPSLVTPSAEAPAPRPAATTPVTSSGLTTPHLAAGPLPPLEKGSEPPMIPSKPFDRPPEPSALPPVPAPGESPEPPELMPELPADTEPLQPPPIRDTIKPAPALRPSGIDGSGRLVPGNRFTLTDDLSTIAFKPGVDNIDTDALPLLDRLAAALQANSGVRITLTAYASVAENSSPRDARRLSLTRALAVRDYLTAKGVPSARIDVRALGVNVPSGEPDRVDIKTN